MPFGLPTGVRATEELQRASVAMMTRYPLSTAPSMWPAFLRVTVSMSRERLKQRFDQSCQILLLIGFTEARQAQCIVRDIGVAGGNDHWHMGPDSVNFRRELATVHFWHCIVSDDDVNLQL